MKRFTITVMLAGLGLASCTPMENSGMDESIVGALDPTGFGKSGLRVGKAAHKMLQADNLTAEQHYYIGRAVAANILSQYPLYEDEQATRYVNEVGATLAAASDMPYVFNGYRFVIADSPEVNAFAMPGAYIIVTRGMLRCCETEDQLAAVLAHEIGHVQREHGMKAIKNDRFGELSKVVAVEASGHIAGGSIPVAEGTRFLAGAAGDMSKQLMVDGYSQKAETEADKDAVVILQRVGYDPNAMVQMLQIMGSRVSPGSSGFGRTHPPASKRIDTLRPLIQTAPVESPAARQTRFDQALAKAVAP